MKKARKGKGKGKERVGTAHELQSLEGLAMLVNVANAKHAHDRIVVASANGTVVPQERIGNAG